MGESWKFLRLADERLIYSGELFCLRVSQKQSNFLEWL